jgi:orotate phosphoribosyltransferase/orotidine-5'-phosphate decarboxylase
MGPVILAVDGLKSQADVLSAVHEVFSDGSSFDQIGYVKVNDAVHIGPDSGNVFIAGLRSEIAIMRSPSLKVVVGNVGIFLDLKLADTSDTNVNTIGAYEGIDILTVRDSVSAKGWLKLRRKLGNKTKLALVSALTDMPIEECRSRYGVMPVQKILNDIIAIEYAYSKVRESGDPVEPFDMVVCSPLDVQFLSQLFGYKFQFIVPGIRDAWMEKGQQARSAGIKQAINFGASFCVMGAQMMKGNPDEGISPEQSRRLSAGQIAKASWSLVVPNDPVATLVSCGGFYESPKDDSGAYIGPLVGYAGKYKADDGSEKNYVGHCYFNVAKAEENPTVRSAFARLLALKFEGVSPDVLLGMPMGGIVFATSVSQDLGCRLAFAEKKVTALADDASGRKEESKLVADRHSIDVGDVVVVFEDVCNNFSTTKKAVELIESKGAIFGGIACIVNRSDKTEWEGKPVISLIHKPSPQFRQDDREVADLVAAKSVAWKPKHEWPRLKAAMSKV